jgi:hypothetical protein
MRHLNRAFVLAALIALANSGTLYAQSGMATITGVVTDPTGASILGVTITLQDPATGFVRTTTTNVGGNYNLPGLRPATYDIEAVAQGFQKYSLKGFRVEVSQVARLDLELKVGALAEQIEVRGIAQLMQTENSSIGAVIDKQQVLDLPLNGRNFAQLALLVPGVNTGQPGAGQGGGVSIGGTRSEQNAFQLDGVSNSDSWDNNIVYRPNVESIQEFKIETSNYSAEFGKGAGGQISVVTKAGTNELHGSLYEFLRNDATQARNLFQRDPNFRNSKGQFIAPAYIQNQFGASAGGPIIRNKTMFFADYEGFRRVQGATGLRSVPDAALKAGNFSSNLGRQLGTDALGRAVFANQVFDPTTTRTVTRPTGGTVAVRDPFAGNQIPRARIDPIALGIMQKGLWPDPNIPGARDTGTGDPRQNYADGRSQRDRNGQYSARVDHRLTSNDTIFARYGLMDSANTSPGSFPGQERQGSGRQQLLATSYTKIITPTIVNEVRFGFQRAYSEAASTRFLAGTNLVKELGIKGLPLAPPGAPIVSVSGFTTIDDGGANVRTNKTFQLIDQLSFGKGRHFFKMGFEVRRVHLDVINNPARERGEFIFGNREWTALEGFSGTGNIFATFLLGLPERKIRNPGDHTSFLRATEYSAYFQDDFKATPKLTISYGVRYQLYIPPKETRNHVSSVLPTQWPGSWAQKNHGIYLCKDPAKCAAINPLLDATKLGLTLNDVYAERLPRVVIGGREAPRSIVDVDRTDFGPRIGLAYRLTPRTTVRSGYGIFFDTVGMNIFQDAVENMPWTLEDQIKLAPFQFGVPPVMAGIGFDKDSPPLTETTPGPNSYSTDFRNSYVQQWNFGVQRQFGNDLVAEVAYAGNKGTKLNRRECYTMEPRLPSAIPATVHPTLRMLFPFVVFDSQMVTLADWCVTSSRANSNYHSLTSRFEKRYSGGLTFLAGFTWSKAMSDAQGFAGGSNDTGNRIQDIFNAKGERGLAPFNHKLRLVSSFLYELPFGKGKRFGGGLGAGANHVIGGWSVNGIASFQSGYPLTILRSGDPLGIGLENSVRPDLTCNPNLPRGERTLDRFYATSCFAAPAAGLFGSAGRGVVTGPGTNSWDLVLIKNTAIFRERVRLQFRSEFFNAFNHPDWGMPGRSFGAGGLGVVASASAPRIIQFGLKLMF